LSPKNRPEEQAGDRGQIADRHISDAKPEDRQEAGQNEQQARDQPAQGPVQQPADIGRKLLRFRPRQKHAEIERVEEALLPDPFLLVDQDAVHDRNLPRRAAEAQRRDPRPDANRLAKADAVIGRCIR
jgi:hypothetical protein